MGRFLGQAPGTIIGLSMKDVLGDEVSAKVIPQFAEARSGKIVTYEREYTTGTGESGWLQMTLRADPDPSTRGVFAVAVDATERHLHEERTGSLVAQLKSANDELESFAYTVSHDLRAPLRAISGFASILNQNAGATLTPEAHHYLERITSNAGKMSGLIEGLLLFSRLARQELTRVRLAPETIVAEIVADHEQDLASRDIRLRVGALPGCSGDPILLKQVFANLIDNAFKYSAGRTPAEIEIGSEDSPEGTVYFVKDNGAGFDPAYAGKLFGVFQRLHSDSEFAGSGIGLATVKRIVGRHGGRVWAESEVGRGARFSFTLGGD
jgi:light-regulated signal transduction histidine kinase (bacteriophytochrome)